MNIFGVGTSELLLILVIAMLVVGPERMVKLARDAGRALAKFRQITESVTKEFRETFSLEELQETEAGQPSSPAAAAGTDAPAPVIEGNARVVGEVGPAAEEDSPEAPAELPASEAAQLEMALASGLVDGEIEVSPVAEAASSEGEEGEDEGSLAADLEPVDLQVAELVPADADLEPVDVAQAVLVADEAPEGEG